MKIIKLALGALVLTLSASAWAFMPANGIWQIDSETNGQPGRGFTLDVENEVMFFTYYGYRADGSSLFYVAAGPIVNNAFTGDLLNVQGGTSLGAAYRPATLATSPGKVTLSFTSGKHGTMTLPGESPKAISKNSFGYADGPDGLLGTWVFTQIIGTTPFVQRKILTKTLSTSTSTGNGLAYTAAADFLCEFQTSGTFVGQVICGDPPEKSGANTYAFKFSGDRGTGISFFKLSTGSLSSAYESDAIRTATKTGARTGLNNATIASVQTMSTSQSMSSSAATSNSATPDLMTEQAKMSAYANQVSSTSDPEKAAALAAWVAEVGTLLVPK